MKRRSYLKDTFWFLAVAVVLLAAIHGIATLGSVEAPVEVKTRELWRQVKMADRAADAIDLTEDLANLEPSAGTEGPGAAVLPAGSLPQSRRYGPELPMMSVAPRGLGEPAFEKRDARPKSPSGSFYASKTHHTGKPKIVVIIDDMGLGEARAQEVVSLPGPLTLAYLPYADNLKAQTEDARAGGHELMIHTPMEPMSASIDPGPIALLTGMEPEAFDAVLKDQVLTSFKGYVGINNHMGSRLTQDSKAMGRVMKTLKERGLFFVDSKTIGSSVAAQTAELYEVPYAERDVFLDHYDTPETVAAALRQLEAIARRDSYAIAIGHPKAHTIAALKEWLPTLESKGFRLVPVSAVVETPWRDAAKEKLVHAPEAGGRVN